MAFAFLALASMFSRAFKETCIGDSPARGFAYCPLPGCGIDCNLVNAGAIALASRDMSRAPRYEPGIARLDSICDGQEFLSAEHVAQLCGVTQAAVRQAVARGSLCPGKIANQL